MGKQKMRKNLTAILCGAAILTGCAHQVQTVSSKAVNIYTTFDQKIKGRWALVLDSSVTDVKRQVKPSSYVCGAHTYPVDSGETMGISVRKTIEALFEDIELVTTIPTPEILASKQLQGSILVRIEDFVPRVTCSTGFLMGSCTSQVEVGFGVVVRKGVEQILATQVSGSKSASGDAGGMCGGAAVVLAEGIQVSTRDGLERLAERISNSPSLRK
jgi:hypothetical protein